MIGDAFVVRLSPLVALAVGLEVVLLAFLVVLGFLPYGAVAHFEEQQTVVILLDEVAQLGLLGLEFLHAGGEYLLVRHIGALLARYRVDALVDDGLDHSPAFYKLQD